jgi:hypothetical protein
MSRPICREDGYEYRVKAIFKHLRQEHAESFDKDMPFEKWLEKESATVADTFIEDVVTYMGIPEDDDE